MLFPPECCIFRTDMVSFPRKHLSTGKERRTMEHTEHPLPAPAGYDRLVQAIRLGKNYVRKAGGKK